MTFIWRMADLSFNIYNRFMHSILIFGGKKIDREREILRAIPPSPSNHPDIKVISPALRKGIGINEARGIKSFLQTKPLKMRGKVVIIRNAETLTLQAQNALLKTLEEPPANSKIIIETRNENRLLPTIISRCKRVNLGNKNLVDENSPEHNEQVKLFVELLEEGRGQRLDFIEKNKQKIASKEYAMNLLDIWVSVLRDRLLLNMDNNSAILNKQNKEILDKLNLDKLNLDTKKIVSLIEFSQELKETIQNTNGSSRLALELFLLEAGSFVFPP